MQSSQQPETTRVNIIALDADGCQYNRRKYTRMFIQMVNKHWEFFSGFYLKAQHIKSFSDLSKEMQRYAREELQKIIHELIQTDFSQFNDMDAEPSIAELGPEFKAQTERNLVRMQALVKQMKLTEEVDFKICLNNSLAKYVLFLNKLDTEVLKMLYLRANQECFDSLIFKLQSECFHAYQIAFGTNRQSAAHDKAGIEYNGTGSIHQDHYYLAEYFRAKLKETTILGRLNTFLLSDLYTGILEENSQKNVTFLRGHSHTKILDSYLGKAKHTDHPVYIFDKTKLTLIYALAHDALMYAPKELNLNGKQIEYVLDFYDNEMPILETLRAVITKHPELLPRGLTLRLYHYDGRLEPKPLAIVPGAGPHDKNYVVNVRKMATMSPHYKDGDKGINAATEVDIPAFLNTRSVVATEKMLPKSHSFSLFEPKDGSAKRAKFDVAAVITAAPNKS